MSETETVSAGSSLAVVCVVSVSVCDSCSSLVDDWLAGSYVELAQSQMCNVICCYFVRNKNSRSSHA